MKLFLIGQNKFDLLQQAVRKGCLLRPLFPMYLPEKVRQTLEVTLEVDES